MDNWYDGIINLIEGLRSTNRKKDELPPVQVVRDSSLQRTSTNKVAPRIEKQVVAANLPTITPKEYKKITTTENQLDKAGQMSHEDYVRSYAERFGLKDMGLAKTIVDTGKKVGEMPEVLFRFARAESNFDPRAVNRHTNAQGLFQFLPSTWQDVRTRLGGAKLGLDNPFDPAQNTKAAALYLTDIKRQLSKVKESLTPGDYYLGHFSGARRASQVLTALEKGRGDQLASTVYLPREIKANRNIFYDGTRLRTIQEVYNVITQKVDSPEDRREARNRQRKGTKQNA